MILGYTNNCLEFFGCRLQYKTGVLFKLRNLHTNYCIQAIEFEDVSRWAK